MTENEVIGGVTAWLKAACWTVQVHPGPERGIDIEAKTTNAFGCSIREAVNPRQTEVMGLNTVRRFHGSGDGVYLDWRTCPTFVPVGEDSMDLGRITNDPNIMGGKPCIRGMRVTAGMIVGLVAAGHSNDEIIRAFPYLEAEDIRQSLLYAAYRIEETEVPLESCV